MRIAVLTSSRADYSIYLPLLRKLSPEPGFKLEIIAFGTHLSKKHGYTIQQILEDGFVVRHKVGTTSAGDSPRHIAASMSRGISGLSRVWEIGKYDLIMALGDRYEMFAAVASSVPFNIPVAHIHGGETTTGAIDNVFRHAITLMSRYHFACAEPYRKRITELTGSDKNVFNTGALSLDNLKNLKLAGIREFRAAHGIDLSLPTVLITFHPETVAYQKNVQFIRELIAALSDMGQYQLVITMPNADTMGNLVRKYLAGFIKANANAIGVESFGATAYLACMKHCAFMLGNTSSGFIEASYFPKYVINLGERQNGRILTPNIVNCRIDRKHILSAVKRIEKLPDPERVDIYGHGNAAGNIVNVLMNLGINF